MCCIKTLIYILLIIEVLVCLVKQLIHNLKIAWGGAVKVCVFTSGYLTMSELSFFHYIPAALPCKICCPRPGLLLTVDAKFIKSYMWFGSYFKTITSYICG